MTTAPALCRSFRQAGLALLAALASLPVFAQPDGLSVIRGHAELSRPDARTLDIINTPGAILHWRDFSIARGDLARFIQQGADSAVLNRVVGGSPSELLGALHSNGRVFLINPNGIVIGAGAVIDTAGFVASSLDLPDADFLAGRLSFEGRGGEGAVVNHGTVIARAGGSVALLGPRVENTGTIASEGGDVVLAAARRVTLVERGLDGISFELESGDEEVGNLGTLLADNGAIGLFASRLNHGGSARANRLSRDADGTIRLEAVSETTVTGSLEATGAGTRGGEVAILGDRVRLRGARIDASGDRGGGRVRIGGDYLGRGSLPTAARTTLDSDTTVRADARVRGDGGEIIVWSDQHTDTHGLLSARGGPAGGDGGLVETSSAGVLDFSRAADVGAPRGRPGTWLLDPEDIEIDGSKAAAIEDALNEGSSVTVRTADQGEGEGNITVSAPITKTDGGDATLTLDAHNRIEVNAPITSVKNRLDVRLIAGADIRINATIATNGGRLFSRISAPVEGPAEPADTGEQEAVSVQGAEGPDADATGADTIAAEAEAEAAPPGISVTGSVTTGGGGIDLDAGGGRLEVTGTLDAAGESGEIALRGGTVTVDGNLHSRGGDAAGGRIVVEGTDIALGITADLDVTGKTGGTILVGGDMQGGIDPAKALLERPMETARTLTVAEGARLAADGTDGDGGTVILWSGERTDFDGTISARGGEQGGDGGLAEVSSKGVLGYRGRSDLRAPAGETGTLLLDPYNLVIRNEGPTTGIDDFTSAADDSILTVADLVAALEGANVIVQTGAGGTQPGNITLLDPLAWDSDTTLTLDAHNDIDLFASLTAEQGGLTLVARGEAGGGNVGHISAEGNVRVDVFILERGSWVQNQSDLPAFHAGDVRVGADSLTTHQFSSRLDHHRGEEARFLRVAGGSGTEADPYQVVDVYGLQGIGTADAFRGSRWLQAADIDAAGTSRWYGGSGFVPIGSSVGSFGFRGGFDGQGFRITGLTIDRSRHDDTGLFGHVLGVGRVSDVHLRDVVVHGGTYTGGLVGFLNSSRIANSSVTGSVTGWSEVGGLVGTMRIGAEIDGASADVTVRAIDGAAGGLAGFMNTSRIRDSYATGDVSGEQAVGGLVGLEGGGGGFVLPGLPVGPSWIENSYATGNVLASDRRGGGLLGYAFLPIIDLSYATGAVTGGDVVGGLVGEMVVAAPGQLARSYASGAVTVTEPDGAGGGLIGRLFSLLPPDEDPAVADVYWDRDSSGMDVAFGRFDRMSASTPGENAIGLTSGQARQAASYAGWDFGPDGDWFLIEGETRPFGRWEYTTEIRNAHQLQLMAMDLSADYTVAEDIDLGGVFDVARSEGGNDYYAGMWGAAGFVPIGAAGNSFTGSLDGQGSRIVGLTINRPVENEVGLFGYGHGATVYALGLEDVSIAGRTSVGGLFGVQSGGGVIEDSYVTGEVTSVADGGSVGGLVGRQISSNIRRSHADARVTGDSMAGGLVGWTLGSSSISDAHATGAVGGITDVGGLVGRRDISVSITRVYSTGAATGDTFTGGLIGHGGVPDGVTRSFWDVESSRQTRAFGNTVASIEGVTGLSTTAFHDTAGFMAETNASEWDFEGVWAPPAAGHYPQLYSLGPVARIDGDDVRDEPAVYGDPYTFGGPDRFLFGPSGDRLPRLPAGSYDPAALDSITSEGGVGYRVVYVGLDALTVLPRSIGLAGVSAIEREYDGTTVAALHFADAALDGDVLDGDDVALEHIPEGWHGWFATPDAGAAVAIEDFSAEPGLIGADAGNYVLILPNLDAQIRPRILNLTGSREYDGTAGIEAADLQLDNLVHGETLMLSGSATLDQADVGDGIPLAGPGSLLHADGNGGKASNYTLEGGDHRVDILPRVLVLRALDREATEGESVVLGDREGIDYEIGGSGLIEGHELRVVLQSDGSGAGIVPGLYAITWNEDGTMAMALVNGDTESVLANYAIEYIDGRLRVVAIDTDAAPQPRPGATVPVHTSVDQAPEHLRRPEAETVIESCPRPWLGEASEHVRERGTLLCDDWWLPHAPAVEIETSWR